MNGVLKEDNFSRAAKDRKNRGFGPRGAGIPRFQLSPRAVTVDLMRCLHLLSFLLATFPLSALTQPPAPAQLSATEPKSSIDWFARASEEMNIRMPGSPPFHMKVTFHAFPGEEVLGPKETPQIMTGDGAYEEEWLAPHKWRREVTFPGYHAIEVESEKGRKMQASPDYEPSRVLMLLNALLDPVPRNFSSREYRREGASGWKVEHLSNGGGSLVRIRKTQGTFADFTDAFYLLPHGLLLSRNEEGLTTNWSNDVNFGGKAVAGHITVQARDRNLLTAGISIQTQSQFEPGTFDLATGPADPGMTLRPLHEIRPASFSKDPVWPGLDSHAGLLTIGVVDRTGRYREVELISAVNVVDQYALRELLDSLRNMRWRPATIDGNICQFQELFEFEKIVNGPQFIGR